jgi:hypothetical protein
MKRIGTMVFLLAMAVTGPVIAQTRPDFSGTWVEDPGARKTTMPAPPQGPKAMPLPPADTVVTQTASDLIAERKVMSQVVRYVYHLDGRESVNHNGANTLTTRSAWVGARLVTTGTSFSATSAGESTWVFKEVRWLDPSDAMITETTHTDEAGTVNTVQQTYRKKLRL